MELARLVVVALVLVAVAGSTLWYRRRQAATARPELGTFPDLPGTWRDGAARTWVVFTTPYCASCEPVARDLRAADPAGQVVKVDATEEVDLAADYAVRRAPTVVMAEADGAVGVRLVGGEAVRSFLRTIELDATR